MADLSNNIRLIEEAIKELGVTVSDVNRLVSSNNGFEEYVADATQLSFWVTSLNEKLNTLKGTIKDIGKGNIGQDLIINQLHEINDLYKNALQYANNFAEIGGAYAPKTFNTLLGEDNARKQAEEARAAADAQAEAERQVAKAQAEAQKQWEDKVNTVKNKVEEVTGYIKQAMANTVKVVRAANNIVNKSISVVVGVFDKLGSAVQRLMQLFGNFGNRVSGFNKQGNILKGTFTELKSKIDLLVGAFNKLYNNSFINEGKKLLSSVQTLNMLIGTELTQETMDWANNLEKAFGLSASGLIADLKELTAVMYGLGMGADDVQMAAKNLEAVAMSLSATTGYDFSTVIGKIQSGMKGMTQSIDDLGLSVRESQMDAFLRKLKAQGGEYANIGTSFSQLTEQQRVYVRYAALMDQFTSKGAYSAENYAKSLRTITGSMSILNSQLRGLKSDIGSFALQLFAKIIQPLIYIIYLVRQAVKWFANLLGIDLTLNPKINGGEDTVKPIEDVTDALEDEAAAADKAKGSLDGLDHVSTMSESKSKKAGDNFDYSSLMGISDDYAKMLEELGKMQDDFLEECKRKFWEWVNSIKERFTQWIKDITGRIIDWDKIKENWDTIVDNLKKTWQNIVRIFQASTNIIGGLLYSIFDDLDATDLLAKLSTVIERFTNLVAVILERVQPYIQDFYDRYLSKYVIKFGNWLEEKLDNMIDKIAEWRKLWDNPDDTFITEWFDTLGKRFENLVKTIKEVIFIMRALFGGEDAIGDVDYLTMAQMEPGMRSVAEMAFSLHNIFEDILDVVKQVSTAIFDINGDGELNMDDTQIALNNIKEKLDAIEQWVDDNKEKISSILTEVVNTITELGKAKFEIIESLIKMIVENADTITAVLRALQEVIKWAAEHPVLAIGLSVAGQTAVNTGKTIITAMMWKKILGLGAGGTAAKAAAEGGSVIGSSLVGGLQTTPGTLGAGGLAGGTAAKAGLLSTIGGGLLAGGSILAAAAATVKGVKEAGNFFVDGVADLTGIINKVDKETGQQIKITAENTKTYAYEIRRALTEAYGEDIDTSKAQRAFEIYAQDLKKTYDLTDEETEYLVRNIERQYERIGSSLDGAGATFAYSTQYSEDNIKKLETAFETLDGTSSESTSSVSEDFKQMSDDVANSTKNASKSVIDLSWKTQQVKATVHNTFRQLASSIKQICAGLNSRIQTLSSNIGIVVRQSDNLRQASQRTVQQSAGWTPVKLKGFASGGIPTSGSLFMANENGNTELVGNFGGYTGVANQSMIIEAMQNAMVQAIRSAGGMGNGGTTVNNFNIGNWLGDDASVRKLANRINTVNAKSNSNIANVGFVMS